MSCYKKKGKNCPKYKREQKRLERAAKAKKFNPVIPGTKKPINGKVWEFKG